MHIQPVMHVLQQRGPLRQDDSLAPVRMWQSGRPSENGVFARAGPSVSEFAELLWSQFVRSLWEWPLPSRGFFCNTTEPHRWPSSWRRHFLKSQSLCAEICCRSSGSTSGKERSSIRHLS